MENRIVCKMLVSKINEVYLQLKVDDDLERELTDYFTFEVPGAKYMPHYRKNFGMVRYDYFPHTMVEYTLVFYLT